MVLRSQESISVPYSAAHSRVVNYVVLVELLEEMMGMLTMSGCKIRLYGFSSMASMIWNIIPIPEWSGGTDECPPVVSTVNLTS
jgi:hypothetical protein